MSILSLPNPYLDLAKDKIVALSDDKQCADFLRLEGEYDPLMASRKEGQNFASVFRLGGGPDRKHNWFAAYHWGFEDSIDNGFIVMIMPRSVIPDEDARSLFTEFIQGIDNPVYINKENASPN